MHACEKNKNVGKSLYPIPYHHTTSNLLPMAVYDSFQFAMYVKNMTTVYVYVRLY